MRIRQIPAAMAAMLIAGWALAQSPVPPGSPVSQSIETEDNWADRVFPPGQPPEVCIYDATRVVGVQDRSFSVRMVTRSETLNRENYAPILPPFADTPTIDVVSLDWAATIPDVDGGERAERMLLYVERGHPAAPVKLAVSVLEPDVVLYKTFEFWKVPLREIYHSTRTGEGDGKRAIEGAALPGDPAVPEDMLPLLVRSLAFQPGRRYALRVLATELTNRAEEPRIFDGFLDCAVPEVGIQVPAGDYAAKDLRGFELTRADGIRAIYYVEAAAPNRLVSWKTNNGRSLRLRKPARGE